MVGEYKQNEAFSKSYIGQLRAHVGPRPLIAPGFRLVLENTTGKTLLMRRSDTGLWGLPSGGIEVGESVFEAAQREVKEETGLTLTSVKAFGFSSDPNFETHTYPNGDVIQNFCLLLLATGWNQRMVKRPS